eukprot:GGOE01044041.1.p2 GENE.GGOE01044041.1~~GGOE01044041.1.p2  ORF type:complete len:127 (-),score=2.57 GGOE01044041.1:31-411(-)
MPSFFPRPPYAPLSRPPALPIRHCGRFEWLCGCRWEATDCGRGSLFGDLSARPACCTAKTMSFTVSTRFSNPFAPEFFFLFPRCPLIQPLLHRLGNPLQACLLLEQWGPMLRCMGTAFVRTRRFSS